MTSVTAEFARGCVRQLLQRSQLEVVVVGDLTPQQVCDAAQKYLGTMSPPTTPGHAAGREWGTELQEQGGGGGAQKT